MMTRHIFAATLSLSLVAGCATTTANQAVPGSISKPGSTTTSGGNASANGNASVTLQPGGGDVANVGNANPIQPANTATATGTSTATVKASDPNATTQAAPAQAADAASEEDAVEVGRSVARSNLFKAAIFGKDPNWGRILASVGTTEAAFDPADLDVALNGVWVCKQSTPAEDPSTISLEERDVTVTIDLKSGEASATVWTNDLTHAYVHENSAYSS